MGVGLEITFWVGAFLFAYTHALYPALMACFGRQRPLNLLPEADLPRLTLIIPAYNEETYLREKLENTFRIDYPRDRLEIIVASDGSSDRTISIAEEYLSKGITLLPFTERRGKASVVNDAVARASGEILCLCDANVMFHPQAIRILVSRLMESSKHGAVSGDVQLRSEESDFGEGEKVYYGIERAFQIGESNLGSLIGVDGGMYVIRKELFPILPADTILDDFVISMRVIKQSRRVVYEPSATASENGTPTSRQEFRRRVRVAAGAVQSIRRGEWPSITNPIAFWQYCSHKVLRWVGPFILLLLVITNGLLWNSGLVYQIGLVCQVSCYLLALFGWLSLDFRKTKFGGVPFYFAMSHVAIAYGLYRGLLNRQRVTWNRTERRTIPSTNITPENTTGTETVKGG